MAHLVASEQWRPAIPEHVPETIQSVIQTCWVDEPSSRPSFKQLIDILEKHKMSEKGLCLIPTTQELCHFF
jgi:hypothetical protein